DGGGNLIEEILERPRSYKTPANIVGLTSKTEAFNATIQKFREHSIHIIRYSDTDSEWESLLEKLIRQKISSKIAQQLVPIDFDYDIAIITAVEIENEAVLQLPIDWEIFKIENDSFIYRIGTIISNEGKSLKVVSALAPLMGMVACSVLTTKIIQNFRPRYLFMPGIAASVRPSTEHGFGDILVIDESWDGGAGKIEKSVDNEYKFRPNANHLRLDVDMCGKVRAMDTKKILERIKGEYNGKTPNTQLSIHIGSVVSVAGVVANEDFIQQYLIKDRKLLGIEMEAYSVYYACFNSTLPRPQVLVCKSVSDFADSNKGDEYQPYSAFVSARFILEFIKGL
ncbi:MAG: hypothetical protein ACN6PI_05245, partial [Sphingobacterium siyangense]